MHHASRLSINFHQFSHHIECCVIIEQGFIRPSVHDESPAGKLIAANPNAAEYYRPNQQATAWKMTELIP